MWRAVFSGTYSGKDERHERVSYMYTCGKCINLVYFGSFNYSNYNVIGYNFIMKVFFALWGN